MEYQSQAHLFCKRDFADAKVTTTDGHTIPVHKNIVFNQAPGLASMFFQHEDFNGVPTHNSPFELTTMATVLGSLYHGRLWVASIYSTGVADGEITVAANYDHGMLRCSDAVANMTKYTKTVCAARYYGIPNLSSEAEGGFEAQLARYWDTNVLFEVMDAEWIRLDGSVTFTSEIPGILAIAARVASEHAPDLLSSTPFLERHFSPFATELSQALSRKVQALRSMLDHHANNTNDGYDYNNGFQPMSYNGSGYASRPLAERTFRPLGGRITRSGGSYYRPRKDRRSALRPHAPNRVSKIKREATNKTANRIQTLNEMSRAHHRKNERLQKLQTNLENENLEKKNINTFVDSVKRALEGFNDKGKFCDCDGPGQVNVLQEDDGSGFLSCANCSKKLGLVQ